MRSLLRREIVNVQSILPNIGSAVAVLQEGIDSVVLSYICQNVDVWQPGFRSRPADKSLDVFLRATLQNEHHKRPSPCLGAYEMLMEIDITVIKRLLIVCSDYGTLLQSWILGNAIEDRSSLGQEKYISQEWAVSYYWDTLTSAFLKSRYPVSSRSSNAATGSMSIWFWRNLEPGIKSLSLCQRYVF